MTGLRQRIEHGFFRFGLWMAHYPKTVLMVMVLLALGLASRIPNLVMDTSTEGFLHEQDPVLLEYNVFRDQYGRDELIAVTISTDGVFTAKNLKRIRALHRDIEENVPHIDDITSLFNARNTRGEGQSLIVEDLLEHWPEDEAALQTLRARALANPVYRNTLLSEDARVTSIIIQTNTYSDTAADADVMAGFDDGGADFGGDSSNGANADGDADTGDAAGADADSDAAPAYLTDEENGELVKALAEVAQRHQADGFHIYLAGSPIVTNELKQLMQTNIKRFMALTLLTIAIILYLLFRRWSGVLMPLLTVLLSLLSTLGIMSLASIPFKLPTQILPSFLIAVGVGASVHLLAIFYRELQQRSPPLQGREAREQAIAAAMGHSGQAIVMTSLTTAAGLISFAGAEVAPVADLGVVAAAGILIALPYTLMLLPALLALTPIKPPQGEAAERRSQRMEGLLLWIADFSVQRRGMVLAVSAALVLFGLAGAMQVQFSHAPHRWLSTSNAVRQANDFVDAHMNGASSVEVIVYTGEENGLYAPRRMAALAALGESVSAIDEGELRVGKTLSVVDIQHEINQALNENRPEFYTTPDNRALIAQEMLLFANSGSDDLEDFVDSGFSQARFTVKMPWVDSMLYSDFITDLKQRFHAEFGTDTPVVVTGMIALLSRTMSASIKTLAESYVIAAGVITLMMILLLGNVRLGLVSMIPNVTPIILTVGLMGWLGLPMDLFTILIGSIAIGLAVDDTIHFMHNFRRYHLRTRDVAEAVRLTLTSTGRAMLVTTAVLSTGFFLYMFSSLSNLFNFGLLTGFTIVMALLADFFLAPALMATMDDRHVLPEETT